MNFQKEYKNGEFEFQIDVCWNMWALPISINWTKLPTKIPKWHLQNLFTFSILIFCVHFNFTWWKWGKV